MFSCYNLEISAVDKSKKLEVSELFRVSFSIIHMYIECKFILMIIKNKKELILYYLIFVLFQINTFAFKKILKKNTRYDSDNTK